MNDQWSQVDVESKDIIFVNSKIYDLVDRKYVINLSRDILTFENFIVIEPEFMLSPTQIKAGLDCIRKEHFLNEFIEPSNQKKEFLILGKIVHKIFEELIIDYKTYLMEIKKDSIKNLNQSNLNNKIYNLFNEKRDKDKFFKKIEMILLKVLPIFSHEIVICSINEEMLLASIKDYFPLIEMFFMEYIINKKEIKNRTLNDIIGTELKYHSQILGMKGIIDCLFTTKINESKGLNNYQNNKKVFPYNNNHFSIEKINQEENEILTPLELKTSVQRRSVLDEFQVLIYSLMIIENMKNNNKEIDEIPLGFGILFYLKFDLKKNPSKNIQDCFNNVFFTRLNFVNLMIRRNILAKSKIVN